MSAHVVPSATLTWDDQIARIPVEIATMTLYNIGIRALQLAEPNIPVDTGALRRSGRITVDRLPNAQDVYQQARSAVATGFFVHMAQMLRTFFQKPVAPIYISYNTPYAIYLHESYTWRPRNWHYVARPIDTSLTTRGKPRIRAWKRMKAPKPAVGGPKWLSNALAVAWGERAAILRQVQLARGVSK